MAAIDDVVKHFVTTKKLRPGDESVFVGWVARQQLYFVRRRGEAIGKLVPVWLTAAGQPDLRARLMSEYDALVAFLLATVGIGSTKGPLLPVLGGSAAADKTPKHLDLADLARRRTNETAGSTVVKTRASNMSWGRLIKVHGIVWRAAALHPEIWTTVPSAANKVGTLAPGMLAEFVDRRLMTVERMQYQISRDGPERDDDFLGAGALGYRLPIDKWGGGARGPWKDKFRVRPFEYPRVSGTTKKLLNLVASADPKLIADPSTYSYLPHAHDLPADTLSPATSHQHWEWHNAGKYRIAWRVLHGTIGAGFREKYEWRIPPDLHDDYTSESNGFSIGLTPRAGSKGSKVIDDLFDMARPIDDYWQRSWLWCDQVICALHTVSMLFGLRRRFGTAAADVMADNLVAGTGLPAGATRPYVQVTNIVGSDVASTTPILHTQPSSKHFESTLVSADNLQIGDHVIFWNHTLYSLLAGGDWRLENAIIMSIDSNASSGKTIQSGVRMQGHGTSVRLYGGFQQEIASKIEDGLKTAQAEVRKKVAGAPAPAPTTLKFRNARLVEWKPYLALAAVLNRVKFGGTEVSLSPWWVEIDPDEANLSAPSDPVDKARFVAAAIPKTYAHRLNQGADYNPPPDTSKIYFPLFEPRFSVTQKVGGKLSGWAAYFAWNEARGTLDKPPTRTPNLMDLTLMTGDLMPGLFLRTDRQFPVVRPRAFV